MQFLNVIVSRYSSTLVQFAITWYIAHELPADAVGKYMILFGVVTTSYVVAGLGGPDGAVAHAPRLTALGDDDASRRLVANVFASGMVFSAALSGLVALATYVFFSSAIVAICVGFWWLGYAMSFVSAQCLVARGSVALGSFIFYGVVNWATLSTLAVYYLLYSSTLDGVLVSTAVGAVLGGSIGLALFIATLNGCGHYTLALPQASMRTGLPLASVRLAQSVFIWSPVWISGALFGARIAGDVGIASRLAMAVGGVVAAVRFSVRPRLVALAATGDWATIGTLGRKISLAAGSLCAFSVVADVGLGHLMLPAVFGAAYGNLWWLLAILLVGVTLESLAGPCDEIMKLTGSGALVLWLQLLTIIIGAIVQLGIGATVGLTAQLAAYSASFGLYYAILVNLVLTRKGVLAGLLPVWRGTKRGPDTRCRALLARNTGH